MFRGMELPRNVSEGELSDYSDARETSLVGQGCRVPHFA